MNLADIHTVIIITPRVKKRDDIIEALTKFFGFKKQEINFVYYYDHLDFINNNKESDALVISCDDSIQSLTEHKILTVIRKKFNDLLIFHITDVFMYRKIDREFYGAINEFLVYNQGFSTDFYRKLNNWYV